MNKKEKLIDQIDAALENVPDNDLTALTPEVLGKLTAYEVTRFERPKQTDKRCPRKIDWRLGGSGFIARGFAGQG